ncbi:MAG TPA: hypothetical protein VNH18_15725 [Bryobacteraceae bacterium]|nr:hypothetical protein [Bryobacteraceae bacterium]
MLLSSRGVVLLIAMILVATTKCMMACSDGASPKAPVPSCHHQSKSDNKPADPHCPGQTLTIVVAAEKAAMAVPVLAFVDRVPAWQGLPEPGILPVVSTDLVLPRSPVERSSLQILRI